jgi:hypothetical protein
LPVSPAPGVASFHELVAGKFVHSVSPVSKSSVKSGRAQSVFELTINEPGAPTSTVIRPSLE